MQIREIRLQQFKRFTDLTISNIPTDAKLVLLIGTNGCGKSSVFDAFNWLSPPAQGYQLLHIEDDLPYFCKNTTTPIVQVTTDSETYVRGANTLSHESAGKFYGRSSLRITPRITRPVLLRSMQTAHPILMNLKKYSPLFISCVITVSKTISITQIIWRKSMETILTRRITSIS